MLTYKNRTFTASIVTIEIESVQAPDAAVEIGSENMFQKFAATVGHHDFLVEGGKEIRMINGTIAKLLTVRSSP